MKRPEVALAVMDVIHERLIVDVWSNETAQNDMRNVIDDYFYDVLRDEMGIELTEGQMDDLLARIMRLAQARFPQKKSAVGSATEQFISPVASPVSGIDRITAP